MPAIPSQLTEAWSTIGESGPPEMEADCSRSLLTESKDASERQRQEARIKRFRRANIPVTQKPASGPPGRDRGGQEAGPCETVENISNEVGSVKIVSS